MFRSLSQDADMGEENDHGNAPVPVVAFGRRRTRAQAKLETNERRERLKRTREAMEAMAAKRAADTNTNKTNANNTNNTNKTNKNASPRTPTRGNKVRVGASFGANLTVEHTPPRADGVWRPVVQRTPEKPMFAKASDVNVVVVNDDRVARLQSVLAPARGIAQSSSSGTRKRMISFSPERAERPINEEAERQKRQRNLKATEKLQLRLEGGPMRTPEKPPSVSRRSTPTMQSPPPRQPPKVTRTASPSTASESNAGEIAVAPSPPTAAAAQHPPTVRTDTPDSVASSCTMELPSGNEEGSDRAPSRASSANASCKKELDFTVVEAPHVEMRETKDETEGAAPQPKEQEQEDEQPTASQEQEEEVLTQPSQDDAAPVAVGPDHSIGFGSSESFTSTSTIEDVGLFNCEVDVEFTGGVYGEGTDGKVSAAMVRGQKVALKRAKPHDGFPEEEAKRRSAIELHYMRRVRHVPGFVQCLGLCDGIEHTCIALEVMDCKLSDYLRRYGQHLKTKSSSSKRRCFTLSLDMTRSMLKHICQPMSELHDTVNVAHGDLACRNILLRMPPKGYEQKWEPVVKLSDFGRIKTPSSEPAIFEEGFSFYKNCDIGAFAREILYRLLVGEIVPTNCTETRTLHKHLQDTVVERIPEQAKEKLGPYYRLFVRCAGWGVRPSFREIVDHLDDLEYFETSDNGFFPLKPSSAVASTPSSSFETASFLSPMGEQQGRGKGGPSSGSKNKYETPTTANPRGLPTTAPANPTATTGVRLLPSKSFTDGPHQTGLKTVNWLKARSVHPGSQAGPQLTKRPANPVASTITSTQPVASTPNGRPSALPRKTPPSAGASRRSLQIINQFQHRLLHEKEKKKP